MSGVPKIRTLASHSGPSSGRPSSANARTGGVSGGRNSLAPDLPPQPKSHRSPAGAGGAGAGDPRKVSVDHSAVPSARSAFSGVSGVSGMSSLTQNQPQPSHRSSVAGTSEAPSSAIRRRFSGVPSLSDRRSSGFSTGGDLDHLSAQLERMWEENKVPRTDREYFRNQYLATVSVQNLMAVQHELSVLNDFQKATQEVMRRIQTRESHLNTLVQLAAKYDPRFYRKEAVKGEVDRIVINIRESTMQVIQSVVSWKSHLVRSLPFQWKTTASYLQKVIIDCQFMKDTPLAIIMGVSVLNNPLLLPQKQTASLNEALMHVKQQFADEFASPYARLYLMESICPASMDRQQRYASIRDLLSSVVNMDGIESYFETLLTFHLMLDNEKAQSTAGGELFMLTRSICYSRFLAIAIHQCYSDLKNRRKIQRLRREKGAILTIQCFWRVRKAVWRTRELQIVYRAACRIQAWFKATLVRIELRIWWLRAIMIQTQWRMFLARREAERMRYRFQCILLFERVGRGWEGRVTFARVYHRHQSAAKIQRAWRGLQERRGRATSLARFGAAMKIQALWREYRLKKWTFIALQLQSWVRREAAKRRTRRLKTRVDAATKIQSWMRGCLAKKNFRRRRRIFYAARTIQCLVRQFLARKYVDFVRKLYQQHCIEVAADIYFLFKTEQAMIIQRTIRRHLAFIKTEKLRNQRAQTQKRLLCDRERELAATAIQCMYRQRKARAQVRTKRRWVQTILWIQKRTRINLYRKYVAKRIAARQIVRWRIRLLQWRAARHLFQQKLAEKAHLALTQRRYNAAVCIQASFRRVLARQTAAEVRRLHQLNEFARRRFHAAVAIQCCFRSFVARQRRRQKWLEFRAMCASHIQAVWRGCLARRAVHACRDYKHEVATLAALKIQTFFRCTRQRPPSPSVTGTPMRTS